MNFVNNINYYDSKLGKIILSANDFALSGLWFEGQKHFPSNIYDNCKQEETSVLKQTKKWLDIYFSGKKPDFEIPVCIRGSEFQKDVWYTLMFVPYGEIVTYGEIAKQIAIRKGEPKKPARAIGSAVACNPVSIIIPCHRIIGANGSLTGYAAGIDKKIKLLELENIDTSIYTK